MKNPFSKVLGLFKSKTDSAAKPADELGSPCCSETQEHKGNGKGESSGASSHCCGAHSDATKPPTGE